MTSRSRDRWFAAVSLAIASLSGVVALGYPDGSAGFPLALCLFVGLLSLLLLVRSRAGDTTAETSDQGQLRTAAAVVAVTVTYTVLIRFVSFEVANYLFLVCTMLWLGERRILRVVIIALGMTLLIKLLFFVLLDVARPTGTWL